MKYLVIGAGGTGGSLGAYMTEAGKDVTVIARGSHLEMIRKNGLKMETTHKENYTVFPMKASNIENYTESPDVIFICVKGYSLDDTIPFIKRVAHKDTVVIPLLNIFGTGSKLLPLEILPPLRLINTLISMHQTKITVPIQNPFTIIILIPILF